MSWIDSGESGECSWRTPIRCCWASAWMVSSVSASVMGQLPLPAPRGGLAAQRSGDRRDVMVDHAEIGAFVRAGRAHRVGKELAADRHLMSARLGAFDDGLQVFR